MGQFCWRIEGVELETGLARRARKTTSKNFRKGTVGFIANSVYKNGVITVQIKLNSPLNPIYIASI